MDQTSGSVITEEWSVHAQLVVHHGNSKTQPKPEPIRTQSNDGGVRMEYCWEPGINSIWETSGTRPARPSYGFQKGNLLFTTSPPQCGINRISEFSKGSSQTFPRYPAKSQDGNKPGKNLSRSPVTTSDTIPDSPQRPVFDSGYASEKFNTLPTRRPPQQYERRCRSTCSITLSCDVPCDKTVNRTQSLRSPSLCSKCNLYRVDDHSNNGNVCEECRGSNKRASRAHTFTTHFCTHVLNDDQEKNIKDAASQTQNDIEIKKEEDKRKHFLKPDIVVSDAKDASDVSKPKNERRKLFRSPARLRGRSPLLEKAEKEREVNKKPPRTVHIDVYCTGSDEADESDSLTSDEEPQPLPQTLYENKDVKVTHRRAGYKEVPGRRKRRIPNPAVINFRKDTDEDLSSQYPSAQSSRTTLLESFGSMPTVSSGLFRSDDTIATSWKDTENLSVLGSGVSLTQSDSFEYADSLDKQRIKQLENKLSEKPWKSPGAERKILLREKIFNDYLESHLKSFPLWKQTSSKGSSSDSEESHDSEIGWTFSTDDKLLQETEKNEKPPGKNDSGSLSDSTPSTIYRYKRRSTLGPFGVKPPSPPPPKLENTIMDPLTSKTECFAKAQLFGPIVGTLRKPGHHVGPAKNPDCTCKSCRWYYEENKGRGRARSVGDIPVKPANDFVPPSHNEEEAAAIREEISELISNQWDLIQNLV